MSKKKEVFQPDDRLFKRMTEDKENVKAYLRHFYPEIAAMADLETLKEAPIKSTLPSLKLFKADAIYRCRFKGTTDEHFYFSLIFEHKSSPDNYVAIQLGLYIMLLLYKLSKRKDKGIEPVLPLIFYNGKEKWEPKTIRQLFSAHPHYDYLEPYLPDFRFLFKNIVDEPIVELLKIELSYLRSILLSMALRHEPELLFKHLSLILELEGKDKLYTIIIYVLAIVERSPEQFMEELKDIEFTTKPDAMSTLEMLKEEGRQEGRKEGESKGQQKERVTQLLKLIINLSGLSASKLADITGLNIESIEKLLSTRQAKDQSAMEQLIRQQLLKDINLEEKEWEKYRSLIEQLIDQQP